MWNRFFDQASDLLAKGERFVVATVVRSEAPTSGKSGDKAIVLEDGTLIGWIGGGCAQPVVIAESKKALAEGKPRLVRISPSAAVSNGGHSQTNLQEQGVISYPMTCHSGGAMDIYLDPVLPKTQLVILGRSRAAKTLAKLGAAVDYRVIMVTPDADTERFDGVHLVPSSDFTLREVAVTPETFIVVSTQGEGDEEALEQALLTAAGYIGFVASKTKVQKVFDYLGQKGIAAERLRQVQAPVGLDLGARSPEEIAVSILAQIVQLQGSQTVPAPVKPPTLQVLRTEAKDPICGMTVDIGKAKHKSEYQGNTFYFCCAGCKLTFEQQPEKYLAMVK